MPQTVVLTHIQAPPDGEFAVMNYRTTQDLNPPFKLYPMVEEAGPFKVPSTPPPTPNPNLSGSHFTRACSLVVGRRVDRWRWC